MANRLPPQQTPPNQLSLTREGIVWLLNEIRRVVALNADQPEDMQPVGAAHASLAVLGHASNYDFDQVLLAEFYFLLCIRQLMPQYLQEHQGVSDLLDRDSLVCFLSLTILQNMELWQVYTFVDYMLEHADEIDYNLADNELETVAAGLDERADAKAFIEGVRSTMPMLKQLIARGRIKIQ
jgi:hypothetical protein